jgi:hypothetical protein
VSRIFINYRREDALPYADRLQEALSEHFGPSAVFRDVDTIEPGLDFVEAIDRALNRTEVMLVLIGQDWLVSSKGERRLHEPEDYVCLEIAAGLKRPNVRVVPVLVGGATMPRAADLPEQISALTRRHAFEMTDGRFRYDRDELLRRLDGVLGAGADAASLDTAPSSTPPVRATAPVAPQPSEPAPPPPTPVHPPSPPSDSNPTKHYVRWGWILAGASLIIPLLAIGGIVLGAITIAKGGGRRTGMGIGIIVASFVIGLFSLFFWIGASSA